MKLLNNPNHMKKINKLRKTKNKDIELVIQSFGEKIQSGNIDIRIFDATAESKTKLSEGISTAKMSPKSMSPQKKAISLLKNQNIQQMIKGEASFDDYSSHYSRSKSHVDKFKKKTYIDSLKSSSRSTPFKNYMEEQTKI